MFAKRVAAMIEKVVTCERIGIMVAGLEVPHAHIHLIPINAVSDLNFAKAKESDPQELATLAARISSGV